MIEERSSEMGYEGPVYYGMDGQRLTLEEWAALYEGDQSGRIVARTELPGGCLVSTVLLGIV